MTAVQEAAEGVDPPLDLQQRFDPIGPPPAAAVLTTAAGRRVRYLDTGAAGARAFVFFGGLATSAGAFQLTEFARSLRESLGLRAISVERNGFGGTPFDPSLGYDDAVDDVVCVLAALAVERFAVVAFSGGAPFAAALAASVPGRVCSLHLAAAACGAPAAHGSRASAIFADPQALAADPAAMWRFEASSPVHRIPGFADAALDEGRRALGPAGRGAGALAHEWRLLTTTPLPDLRAVRAPAYLYHGARDDITPLEHAERWRRALPRVAAWRSYDGEAHDVQYRHWDQILLDVAGRGGGTLLCRDGRARLVPEADAAAALARGAQLGLCAWGRAGSAMERRRR